MFRRKPSDSEMDKTAGESSDELGIPTKPAARPAAGPQPLRSPTMPPRMPEASRAGGEAARAAEPPRPIEVPRRGETAGSSRRTEAEMRTLIVGREIALSGEITSCDRLVVEGSVEANLANCRDIDIAESGLFKGSASIEDAEIRGRFEGVLTVKKRLMIRATGRVVGTVRYGQIEIERGGRISGDVQADPSGESGEMPETSRPAASVGLGQMLESKAS